MGDTVLTGHGGKGNAREEGECPPSPPRPADQLPLGVVAAGRFAFHSARIASRAALRSAAVT